MLWDLLTDAPAEHETSELGGRAAGRRGTRACRQANPVVTVQPFTLVKVRGRGPPLLSPFHMQLRDCPVWCQCACSPSPAADTMHVGQPGSCILYTACC